MDNRIGQRSKDGAVLVWPSLTVSGLEYTRPATTLSIGDGAFIVIQNETAAQVEAALAELLATRKESTDDEQPARRTKKPVDTDSEL